MFCLKIQFVKFLLIGVLKIDRASIVRQQLRTLWPVQCAHTFWIAKFHDSKSRAAGTYGDVWTGPHQFLDDKAILFLSRGGGADYVCPRGVTGGGQGGQLPPPSILAEQKAPPDSRAPRRITTCPPVLGSHLRLYYIASSKNYRSRSMKYFVKT